MNRSLSLYFDLARVVAALLVILYHSNMRLLSTAVLPLSGHGHAAVIVFFVLSGYVIAYITATREHTSRAYWVSRLSRFYSVALPAVLLAPLLDMAGEALAPQFYAGATTHDLAWVRVISSLGFLNEIWSLSIMSFSNVPYWSLCYEFWYYALYALYSFGGGRRWMLCGAMILALGPKIALLAPIWILGVVLYRWRCLGRIGRAHGAWLWCASWLAYGLFHGYGLTEAGSDWLRQLAGERLHHELAFSKFFITDYLLGLLVACNFVGARAMLASSTELLERLAPLIRALAGLTFSAYIFHQPLLQFYAAAFNGEPSQPWFYAATMAATLVSIAVLGYLTEHQRRHWRRWFDATWAGVGNALAAPIAGSGGRHD
jgi:peptidoglycan/LPS O-acetylase OafA/YrhL